MRFPNLIRDDVFARYAGCQERVADRNCGSQTAWSFQADDQVRLGKFAHALALSTEVVHCHLADALNSLVMVFGLRGTAETKFTGFQSGKPLPTKTIVEDGFTSRDVLTAIELALIVSGNDRAFDVLRLSGDHPNADRVSPRSETYSLNDQTLVSVMHSLLQRDYSSATEESRKFEFRRCTKIEKQYAATLRSIADDADIAAEIDALLFFHDRDANSGQNSAEMGFWLCLPALASIRLALDHNRLELSDLLIDSEYCPLCLIETMPEERG